MMHKTALILQNLLCGAALVLVGASILLLSQYPELASALANWVESLGITLSLCIAIVAFASGLWLLSSTLELMRTKVIVYTKGALRSSLGKELLNQTVQQIWREYFQRTDLSVSVVLKRHSLEIFGQVPESWNNKDDLAKTVSDRLLSTTGYWGEICLYLSPATKYTQLFKN